MRRYLQGQGHTWRSKVKNGHKLACTDHNYVIHSEILKSLGTFVSHLRTVCHANELRQYLQGQGHTWRSKVKNGHKLACTDHNYVIHSEILKSLDTIVNHNGTVCHRKELRRYLQRQGHTWRSKVKDGHKLAWTVHNYVIFS